MTRIETFADAAFAFAVTMLVISVEAVPQNYEEFAAALKSIPAFFASFLQLAMFWMGHRAWSRAYGLDDMASVWLSLLLIASVLVIVFPLRVIFSAAFAQITGGWSNPILLEFDEGQFATVFVTYGVAFGGLSTWVALMYAHAWRQADALALNRFELLVTVQSLAAWVCLGVFGFSAAVLAVVLPPLHVAWAGWVYTLLMVFGPLLGIVFAVQRRRLLAADPALSL